MSTTKIRHTPWEDETFSGKRRLYVLQATDTMPETLNFREVIVYSSLVSRLRMTKGDIDRAACSKKQIATMTGLSRTSTVGPAIEALRKLHLVQPYQNKWLPIQDSEKWFSRIRKTEGKVWYKHYLFYPALVPAVGSALPTRHSYLFWKMFQYQGQRGSFYAKLLRIDRKTVTSSLKTLRRLGLVVGNTAIVPTAEQLSLWGSAKTKPRATVAQQSEQPQPPKPVWREPLAGIECPEPQNEAFNEIDEVRTALADSIEIMRNVGYSETEIKQVWHKRLGTPQGELLLREFSMIMSEAQNTFIANRGNFPTQNSYNLLQSIITRAINSLGAYPLDQIYLWQFEPMRDLQCTE